LSRRNAACAVAVNADLKLNRGASERRSARGLYGPTVPLFPQRRPSGRVDLSKSGNTVRAVTSGVRAFTLLVSPDVFDLGQPVTVVANGTVVVNRLVDPSLATLLKWAALDNDRAMLFAAEVRRARVSATASQSGPAYQSTLNDSRSSRPVSTLDGTAYAGVP
jgi:hypothetical protein